MSQPVVKTPDDRGDLGHTELQLEWDAGNLDPIWPSGPDTKYVLVRTAMVASDVTAEGGPGRVLEVAAADAVHACRLSLAGMDSVVLEPSLAMLAKARQRIAEHGARVTLVRGVAETLPFADHSFDRVLIDSALDHLGHPELSLREMTRVLKPDGRLVLTFVNYGSLSVRLSRLLYRVARRIGLASRQRHLPWDSPVPIEHTFECTYPVVQGLCRPHLELDRAFGMSIGWLVPGWGALLGRLTEPRAMAVVRALDRLAYRWPRGADLVVSVWRPRRVAAAPAPAAARGASSLAVQPGEVVYGWKIRAEARYWAERGADSRIPALARATGRRVNQAFSGDPDLTWLDDLMRRGPFRHAAQLGADDAGSARRWLERHGSQRLDVYELSPRVIRRLRRAVGAAAADRLRGIAADLNFVSLPPAAYDVVWSDDCLHHVVNLERLFDAVERALRPGGLFAFHDYVGESRMQYSARRLHRLNALLDDIPAQWRRGEGMQRPPLHRLSPLCAVRSEAILGLAAQRFEVVHYAGATPFGALQGGLDVDALEREAPELAARVQAAEAEALRDPEVGPLEAYVVLRKRP